MSDSITFYSARLIQRYKRFLADVRLPSGEVITLHCPNTGSMKNCIQADSPCWYSTSTNLTRKYLQTLEIVTTPTGHMAGINTSRANTLVEYGITQGTIAELQGYTSLRREVVYGNEKSRIDFLLQRDDQCCYVEVKSVTLMEQQGQGLFPDAVSARGTKHLRELTEMVAQGHRAVLFYCVQHSGIDWVEPADHIDPVYGLTLRQAIAAGVEVMAYRTLMDTVAGKVVVQEKLPVVIE